MLLRQIFDPYLAQYAYLVGCQRSGEALIIDPQRDIDRYKFLAKENGVRITAVAETHIHADFVSGAQEFVADPDIHLYLSGEGGPDWNYHWPKPGPNTRLLKNGDSFMVGNIRVEAIHTPGHTPEHLSYLITDLGGGADQSIALASGDFVFVGDVGRPDLLESAAGKKGAMEPAARQLQESLHNRLTPFADFLQILPAHGSGSACGKALGAVPTSTLGYERRFNGALKLALNDPEAFIKDILAGQPEPPLYFATMKRVNRDGIAATGALRPPPHLAAEVFTREAANSGTRILDARSDRESFDAGHVPHAIHAPLKSSLFSTSAGSYLAASDSILLVLENGDDADLAARQLYRIGFDKIVGWITTAEAQENGLFTARLERINSSEFNYAKAVVRGEIIDVRTTAEFQSGHLEGARSFPYTRLKAHLDELPKDRRLFVHCGSGKRAALAASFLLTQGFDAVHVDGVCDECERIAEDRDANAFR
jgi:hydroxyacylglutathione hydrolase